MTDAPDLHPDELTVETSFEGELWYASARGVTAGGFDRPTAIHNLCRALRLAHDNERNLIYGN